MKKKFLRIYILLFTILCFSSLLVNHTVKATEIIPPTTQVATATQIRITQNPTKVTYTSGESFNPTGMVVECTYSDGTIGIVTDYTIDPNDSNLIGPQVVTIRYQNCTATLPITINPGKVAGLGVLSHSTTSYTLSWNTMPYITGYELYVYDITSSTYRLERTVETNSVTMNVAPGTINSYQVRAVKDVGGIKYYGEFSDIYQAATNPEKVMNLQAVLSSTVSIKLTWDAVPGATGYSIYRYDSASGTYIKSGNTTNTAYIDRNLNSGKGYIYRVCAYTLNDSFRGQYSDKIKTSTNPARVTLKYKSGEGKIRLKWAKVTGASSYDVYMKDDTGEYTLLTSNAGYSNCSYVADGLTIGNTYSFYAIARRQFDGLEYVSPESKTIAVTMKEIEDTSTIPKYFTTKEDFVNSSAYTNLPFFKDNISYSKSVVIPGLVTTKVDGFNSNSMCPQGITFAKNYLLITAYDTAYEENSVVYVVDMKTKKLLSTITLPTKAHLGGIAYDGTNVWVTVGKKVASIPFSQIESAVQENVNYVTMEFSAMIDVGMTASYIAYGDSKLWVGTYDELNTTTMESYTVNNEDSGPYLEHVDTLTVPTRVQGVAFTKKGYLILSRSCQLYEGLRGYMHQLDVYLPKAQESDGKLVLGDCLSSIEMPSMNEGIAFYGSYLYVNFESGAFDKASYKMDRICAFKLSSIIKTISKE
ncbi:MAG TPA: bacterial Ig-like domain-containing protein [Lachnospiraceae bacterium]|nr:bacterial Ig-like domain-containing protein [Lachnospiraceae bacterium]